MFHPEVPVIKYHQKAPTSCCLSSLASDFHSIGDNKAINALVNRITELLTLQIDKFRNIIHFYTYMTTNRMHIKGENHLRYNMKIWNKNDAFYILKNISEYVTLVQLMDSLGDVNHAISIVGYCIFYSNYEKALCLTKYS